MDSTVRALVAIALFAFLCAITAFMANQGAVAAIFVAESSFALAEAVRRSW